MPATISEDSENQWMNSETGTIGFIGLGNMGANMARCLQRAGFSLCVYDINSSAADELELMS